MSRMIQIRNVPDAMHRTLKIRAATAGMSLSDYLIAELRKFTDRPTLQEFRARLHARGPTSLTVSAARLVRDERDRR